jgi:NADH:ubiquinone oxidoreductase subunit H
LIPAFIVLAVIPLGPTINIPPITIAGRTITIPPINQYVTDVNIGVLYVLSISSVGVLGIILGGWASNSKYPLLGALRSAAQMVSYEVALGFSLIGVLMLAGSFSKYCRSPENEPYLVCFLSAARFHPVLYMRRCRNEPGAIRLARSRIRACRRVSHGVQRFPILPVFPR